MGFNPSGVVSSSEEIHESASGGKLPKEKIKQEFVIHRVTEKRNMDNYYEFIAVPVLKNDSFTIPTEDGVYSMRSVSVKGYSSLFFEANFKEYDKVICYGKWENDIEKDEIVFHALNIYEEIPNDIESLRKFLSGNRLPRIGEVTANEIIRKWGMKTFDILDFEPEKLVVIKGITEEHIPKIKEKWSEIRKVYEIIATLSEYGVSEDVARKAYRYYTEKSEIKNKKINIIEEIKKDPYDLTNIEGIGFKRADHIGQSLGHSPNSKKRVAACLTYCLTQLVNESGNTAVPAIDWILRFSTEIDFDKERSQKCCQWFIDQGYVYFKIVNKLDRYGNKVPVESVILKTINTIEKEVALSLKRLVDNAPKLSSINLEEIKKQLRDPSIKADDTQKEAILTALSNGVSVVTGGPGTGKTTTCKNIVHFFVNVLRMSVYLSAPTGKAAQRMGEQIGQGLTAETIHRMLGAKNYFFDFNSENQMPVGVYLVDESSMIDIYIAKALLDAIPSGSILIFVGDADQLPSVGPGDVLRDIIKSGYFNVATLKKPHRYANGADIGINADLINRGLMPDLNSGTIDKNSSFVFIEKFGDSEIYNELLNVLEKLHNEKGVSYDDIQILSPQKNKLVGVESLNMNLRPIFNPEYAKLEKEGLNGEKLNMLPEFYNGDRVMQLKNNREIDLYNGDVGYVSDYSFDYNTFKFNEVISKREVGFDKTLMKNLNLAYAITVHKSQGSESPYIIIPLSAGHFSTLNRNNVYTGITRAKQMVILIGTKKVLKESIDKIQQRLRVTLLADELDNIFGKKKELKVDNSVLDL